MTSIKLESGLELEIDERLVDDMEMLEAIAAIQDGEVTALPHLVTLLLGVDGKKALYDHLREDGRVPIKKVSDAVTEILKALNSKKK